MNYLLLKSFNLKGSLKKFLSYEIKLKYNNINR